MVGSPSDNLQDWIRSYQQLAVAGIRSEAVAQKIARIWNVFGSSWTIGMTA
jgi:hypothetical protein